MAKFAAAIPALAGVSSFLGPLGGIASAIGSVQSLGGQRNKGGYSPPPPAPPAVEAPFAPKKPAPIARPGELSNLGGFDPGQERSSLATKGVNVGLGKDEDSYYRNLVSRSLIGDDNKITGDSNSLLPVENQYFSGKGFDTSSISNLLKAIMGG